MNPSLIVCIIVICLLIVCLLLMFILWYRTNNKLKNITKNKIDDKKVIYDNLKDELNEKLINSLQTISYNSLDFQTYSSVTCNSPEIRSRLVGKEARNKRVIENLTGVNLDFSSDTSLIKICSNNFIERERARLLINALINSNSNYIDEVKIKKYFDKVNQEFEQNISLTGQKVIKEVLHLDNIDPKIYKYVGRMQYRLSYSQNNLEHSIECAIMAYQIANIFNLDPNLAAQCAFFHDIGKSVDYDSCMHHCDAGLQIAKICNLPEDVAYCIKYHHDYTKKDNKYLLLTRLVDRLSASKDGLRTKFDADVKNKKSILSNICNSFDEIKNYNIIDSAHTLIIDIKNNAFVNISEMEKFVNNLRNNIKQFQIFVKYYLEIRLKYNNNMIKFKL